MQIFQSYQNSNVVLFKEARSINKINHILIMMQDKNFHSLIKKLFLLRTPVIEHQRSEKRRRDL